MSEKWFYKRFGELSAEDLYEIMTLRQQVFVVEQQCAYIDCDGKDKESLHLGLYSGGTLIAYARIVNPGISYDEVSIGRVVTAPSVRGTGLGILLMEKALQKISEEYGDVPIKIGAQTYLKDFYSRFGFVAGSAYLEDGIPHTHMLRKP